MEENPYKAPIEAGSQGTSFARHLLILVVGAILLVPACWALGRLIIPPDDLALRFSIRAYGPALVMWVAYTCWRWTASSVVN